MKRSQSRHLFVELGPGKSAFGFFSNYVHLHENIHGFPAVIPELADCIRQSRAVESVKERETIERLHLVSLKMSDQMPPHRSAHLSHFGNRFLNSILADVGKACLVRRKHGLGSMGLGHCDNRHRLTSPTTLDRERDARADLRDSRSELRKKHSLEI
jgi:hypothetical protein